MKKRQIKKYGGSHAVKLEPIDLQDNNLKEGDELDLESALARGKVK